MGPLIQNYTDLKYNILVAIAVSWSKRVDAIGRRRPVEHHWFIRGMSEIVLDLTPLRGGSEGITNYCYIKAIDPDSWEGWI